MKLKPIKDNDDDVPIFLHIYVVSHAHLLPCVGPSFQNRPEKFFDHYLHKMSNIGKHLET